MERPKGILFTGAHGGFGSREGIRVDRRERQVTIHKADGNALTIQANHSITAQQIAWFKAGSALNALN